MGVKVTTVKNDFLKLEKSFNTLSDKKVQVGVLGGGENAWLAGIHEYGCNIPVTDKMRKYLASRGLYLKKGTTEIHIPERSFLRSGFDECHEEAVQQVERMISTGLFDADAVCEFAGLYMTEHIQEFGNNLSSPPKHPFTLKQNGGKSNPLVDSGDMIGSISYRVE